jgi:antitoxin MazE
MTANLINIGNSKGLILPKALLKKLKISTETELELESTEDYIIIKKVKHRSGWIASAKKMNLVGDDHLLLEDSPTHFEQTEWTW